MGRLESARLLLVVVVRTYGWRGVWRRAIHELRRRLSWFRRRPRVALAGRLGERRVTYRPGAAMRGAVADSAVVIERGRRVVQGMYEAYGHDWRSLPTGRAAWSTHPKTGYSFTTDVWWKVPHLPKGSDIKDVWEPGRFSWVYDLVRAHAATGDPDYAAAFHRHLREWRDANPPFFGVQWACGQETALRALALLHADDALPAPVDDAAASARLVEVLGWSGERIADAIGYGLSQRNNHGLSEPAGLIHLALRLAGVHPDAARWLRLGRRRLEEQLLDQFYDDGWYAQHSFTYLRVALEQVLLVQRALSASGTSLSPQALARVGKSVRLLALLVDPQTGHVPNHGANDGGRVAVYSTAPYRDFRPILTLAAVVLEWPLPAGLSADAQVLAWLGAQSPSVSPAIADGVYTGESGWVIARVRDTFVFLTAGSYRHRPSHMDMLHVDVRLRGAEVVLDPGTFAYNAAPPWNNPLAAAAFHNGPVLDDAEPAERGPRFFWYTWPEAQVTEATYESGRASIAALLPGRVERRVHVEADAVSIVDTALDPKAAKLEVNWLVDPGSRAALEVAGSEVAAATEGSPVAWFSPTYGHKQAMQAVRARASRSRGVLQIATRVRPS